MPSETLLERPRQQSSAGPGDIQGWLGVLFFYGITLMLELPSAVCRMLVVYAVFALAYMSNGYANPDQPATLYAYLAMLFPLIFSASALIYPFGTASLWRARTGGRRPSERERLAYDDAVAELKSRFPDLPTPDDWFVIDELDTNAMVYGRSLALHRGLFESDYLTAVLAHELGHLNTSDGKLTVALNRLLIWHRRPQAGGPREPSDSLLIELLRLIRWAAGGGHSLGLLRGVWGTYFREREYDADTYATKLGEGDALAEFLETHAWPYDRPIPFTWLSDETHPSTELRLERLWREQNHAIAA